jgi:GNAT superfamily N-acetyltransferase
LDRAFGCSFAMSLRLQNFHGTALSPHLDALGQLRITVFREFPYLYDGSLEYERDYLHTYLDSPDSLVVLAFDGETLVGATTCLPLRDEGPEFQAAFVENGYDIASICYFGESILLPAYRSQGIGKTFFARREAHAASLPGIRYTTFCAVDRPQDHPLRPAHYRPLDGLWQQQGYTRHPELQARFVWKEIGEPTESPKSLTFWLKSWPTP